MGKHCASISGSSFGYVATFADEPDRDVELVALQIRLIGARKKVYVDPRVNAVETRQSRREPHRGEAGRRRDREGFSNPGDLVGHAVEQPESFVGGAVELLPCAGELQCPVFALKEGLPQLLLERPDLAADRGLRDEELLRGAREAQMSRRDAEAAQQVERESRTAQFVHVGSGAACLSPSAGAASPQGRSAR